MMQAIRVVAILAIAGLAGVLGYKYWADNLAPREPMPELTLTTLEGRDGFDPATIEGAYILNVWGSWCGPCRAEHPVLMALRAEGYAIYGLNWRDTPEDANAFLDELGDPFRGVMQDVDGRSVDALGITGAPETLVIGSDGRILARWPGAITTGALRTSIYPALERDARRNR